MNRRTHLTNKKKSRVVHIYLKPEHEETYRKMAEILRREGRSFSDFIWERAEKYALLHGPGNPQQQLPRYGETDEPYVAPKLCEFGDCDNPSVAVGTYSRNGKEKKYRLCKEHFTLAERSANWRNLKIRGGPL